MEREEIMRLGIVKPMEFETPLCELAYKYGTDKCPQVVHSYTPYYYEIFKHKQGSVRKLVELGIGYAGDMKPPSPPHYQTGASLLMWRDFFPNAQVYGADIRVPSMIEAERVKTFLCDEEKEGDLKDLVTKTGSDVDIFIDDAIHLKKHQIFAARILMPLLDRDVTYIIEDVRSPDIVMAALEEYDCEMVKFNRIKRQGDCLVIVRHRRSC
jgi:hypothetical protein